MSDKDKWYTPRYVLDPLGYFDLDPCNDAPEQFPVAEYHFTPSDDGLQWPRWGRVWLNPPFSNARPWIDKLAEHGNGIALVFCRSDAIWFHRAITAASACL